MNWVLKARLQRILSGIPGGRKAYGLGQRFFGNLREVNVEKKIEQVLPMVEKFYEGGNRFENKNAVEIGTGWTPVVPLFFWMLGQEKCVTLDVSRLLNYSMARAAARQLVRFARESENFFPSFPAKDFAGRTKALFSLVDSGAGGKEIMEACGIDNRVSKTMASAGLASGSVDLIYSTSTFEHIPETELPGVLCDSFRILKPGGIAMHAIDTSDHFSHSDASLSPINFLRFPAAEFENYNNSFCFQNRLRAPEYKKMFLDAGFQIVYWEAAVNGPALLSSRGLPVDEKFKKFSAEENCALNITVIAKKP